MAGGFQQDVDNSTNTFVENIKTSVRTSSPFAWFSLVNCLLLCLCVILHLSNNTQAVQDNNVDEITEMADNHDDTKLLESKIDSLNMLVATFRVFTNARIDIKNINKGKIVQNTPYQVSIVDAKGIYDQKKGLFKIEGESAKIKGDQLTGTKNGTVDLVYIYDGVEVKRRPVKVIKQIP